MISVRNLVTGMILGGIVCVLVRELNEYGLAFANWSLKAPRIGEAIVTGILIGAISQLVGQRRPR